MKINTALRHILPPELTCILKYLPEKIGRAVNSFAMTDGTAISEIRLRRSSPVSLTVCGKNIELSDDAVPGGVITSTESDIRLFIMNLTGGSLYSQSENIKQGFIAARDNIRVGIAGNLNGIAQGDISQINSICIRVPAFFIFPAYPAVEFIKKQGAVSFLICSPPAGGKTSVLRYLCDVIPKGGAGINKKYRTALIDSRCEIYMPSRHNGGLLDVILACTKAEGIETATRVMNPELIICDEIGAGEDTEAILSAQNSGVPLIATCHAPGREALHGKKNIMKLIENNVFEYFIFQSFRAGGNLSYEVCGKEKLYV